LCYPAVPFIACDNKEAHLFAHVKLNSSKRPCRFCNAEKFELHDFNSEPDEALSTSDKFMLRSYEDLQSHKHDVEWCSDHSVHKDIAKVTYTVLLRYTTTKILSQSCILNNYPAFGIDPSHYFSVLPPDMLHTVHAGIVRFSVCWALSILKVCS